jgi:peroxiredoxin
MTGKLKVGDDAPNIQVMDADGNTLALSSMWSDKPVVLTFLRHFG